MKLATVFNILLSIQSLYLSSSSALEVLWIGNSYTSKNDVPGTVKSLSTSDGHTLHYDQQTGGGWTWEMHANSEKTINKIKSRPWDVVILQEQSELPAFGKSKVCADTVEPLNTLVKLIKENNQTTIIQFYNTWGNAFGDEYLCPGNPQFCTYSLMQDALTNSYSTFSCMNRPSRMTPVGEGFRKMEELYGIDARLSLYKHPSQDNNHASVKGSYLSACLHYLALFGPESNVIGNPAHGGLNNDTALLIQELSEDVWNKGSGWEYPQNSDCQPSFTC